MNYNETRVNIKDTLIKLRKAHNLSQEQISEILGIKRDTYASWEIGRSAPKYDTIIKLAKIYNVTCDYIITGQKDTVLSVASPNRYNADVYGDEYVSELSSFEKAILLKLRILNLKDKQKVAEFIYELENEQKNQGQSVTIPYLFGGGI